MVSKYIFFSLASSLFIGNALGATISLTGSPSTVTAKPPVSTTTCGDVCALYVPNCPPGASLGGCCNHTCYIGSSTVPPVVVTPTTTVVPSTTAKTSTTSSTTKCPSLCPNIVPVCPAGASHCGCCNQKCCVGSVTVPPSSYNPPSTATPITTVTPTTIKTTTVANVKAVTTCGSFCPQVVRNCPVGATPCGCCKQSCCVGTTTLV